MSGEIFKINLKTCDRNFCVNQSEGYHTLKNPEREGDLGIHYDDLLESLRSKENAFKGMTWRLSLKSIVMVLYIQRSCLYRKVKNSVI